MPHRRGPYRRRAHAARIAILDSIGELPDADCRPHRSHRRLSVSSRESSRVPPWAARLPSESRYRRGSSNSSGAQSGLVTARRLKNDKEELQVLRRSLGADRHKLRTSQTVPVRVLLLFRSSIYGLNQYDAFRRSVLFGCCLNKSLRSCERLKSLGLLPENSLP